MAPSLRCRATPRRKLDHLQHADALLERQSNDVSDIDLLARLLDALAVDANISRFDQGLRRSAAFHQPDAVEIEVEPQVPSALAWRARRRHGSRAHDCPGAADGDPAISTPRRHGLPPP